MAEEPKTPAEAATKKSEKQPVSEEEMRTIFSGPALAANKIYVTVSPAGVRLTFCEQWGKVVPATFRTAVLMSFPDAIALSDLLARQLENVTIEVVKADSPKDG